MSKFSIKEAALAVLSKSATLEEAAKEFSVEELNELNVLMKAMNKKTGDGRYGKPNPDVDLNKDDPTNPPIDAGAASAFMGGFGAVKSEVCKVDKNGQWNIAKEELSKPPRSEAQRKAMWAAAGGHSNLGIPASVGKDFAESDPGGKLPEKKMKKEEKEMKQVKVQMDTDTYEPRGKHNPVMAAPTNLKKSWVDGAQWTLEKAIKPGPALDYSQFNKKPDYAEIEAKAPTIDYGKTRMDKPKWSGAVDRAKATRAKIDAEANETGAETLARRQRMNKQEGGGANSEPELPAEKQKRMVAKNEMMGYGPADPQGALIGNPGKPTPAGVAQSEKEPHKDDPQHEAKEKKKAKKIKDEAESLLDMHKS